MPPLTASQRLSLGTVDLKEFEAFLVAEKKSAPNIASILRVVKKLVNGLGIEQCVPVPQIISPHAAPLLYSQHFPSSTQCTDIARHYALCVLQQE